MNKTWGFAKIYVSARNIYIVEKIKLQSDATIYSLYLKTITKVKPSLSTFNFLLELMS